jgi:methylated-DNA-[protein]-cysteine S-methyltransferase
MLPQVYKTMTSPVGELTLVADDQHLLAILWEHKDTQPIQNSAQPAPKQHRVLAQAEKQLREYFQGTRTDFDLPLKFAGTDFQTRIWLALRTIPYGQTLSYSRLAKQIGSPRACRAAGAANGQNPIPIVVPCHRVISENGKLTGFGGGLEAKAYLLELETRSRVEN